MPGRLTSSRDSAGDRSHAWHELTIAERPYRSTHSKRYRWRVGTLAALALALLGSPWGLGLGPACRYHHDCTLHAAAAVCIPQREGARAGWLPRALLLALAARSRGLHTATVQPRLRALLARCCSLAACPCPYAPCTSLARVSSACAWCVVTWCECEVCREGASPPAARLET
eukprot:scaffold10581_cov117-Isochrysis_galbana.AAC.3